MAIYVKSRSAKDLVAEHANAEEPLVAPLLKRHNKPSPLFRSSISAPQLYRGECPSTTAFEQSPRCRKTILTALGLGPRGGTDSRNSKFNVVAFVGNTWFFTMLVAFYLLLVLTLAGVAYLTAMPTATTSITTTVQPVVAGFGQSSGYIGSDASASPQLVSQMSVHKRNRRMALEQQKQHRGSSSHSREGRYTEPLVEYRDAGFAFPISNALDIMKWHDLRLYDPSEHGTDYQQEDAQLPHDHAAHLHCPTTKVRLFMGITSRCCTASAQAKRQAIRDTWLQNTYMYPNNVTFKFILSQPSTAAEYATATDLLTNEVRLYNDIVILPGEETYRNLPSKTLQLMRYALTSPCKYTHVMKTDDDVYIRMDHLLNIIETGQHDSSLAIPYSGARQFDGVKATADMFQSPWMTGMYVGQLDSNKSNVFPGWAPIRQPDNKWYLSEKDASDEMLADNSTALRVLGVRWASGWGYMLSRDLVEMVVSKSTAIARGTLRKPAWWGRMPWEDILIAALLQNDANISHHQGFKAAWQACSGGGKGTASTVLKHLDNDAPMLQEGLYVQEMSGLWDKTVVTCSSGPVNNYTAWRTWRNSLPDTMKNGFM